MMSYPPVLNPLFEDIICCWVIRWFFVLLLQFYEILFNCVYPHGRFQKKHYSPSFPKTCPRVIVCILMLSSLPGSAYWCPSNRDQPKRDILIGIGIKIICIKRVQRHTYSHYILNKIIALQFGKMFLIVDVIHSNSYDHNRNDQNLMISVTKAHYFICKAVILFRMQCE